MLHSLSCLTVGGAGEGEAGEDPEDGHGSNMKAPSERRAFIPAASDGIGRDRRAVARRRGGEALSDVRVQTAAEFSIEAQTC